MLGSMSSQSLNELMQRDGEALSRNMSRENLMHDTLLRNVSDTSLNDMVRNYSSASLEAVMEHGQHHMSALWPAGAPSPPADASRSAHKVLALHALCVWILVLHAAVHARGRVRACRERRLVCRRRRAGSLSSLYRYALWLRGMWHGRADTCHGAWRCWPRQPRLACAQLYTLHCSRTGQVESTIGQQL